MDAKKSEQSVKTRVGRVLLNIAALAFFAVPVYMLATSIVNQVAAVLGGHEQSQARNVTTGGAK